MLIKQPLGLSRETRLIYLTQVKHAISDLRSKNVKDLQTIANELARVRRTFSPKTEDLRNPSVSMPPVVRAMRTPPVHI